MTQRPYSRLDEQWRRFRRLLTLVDRIIHHLQHGLAPIAETWGLGGDAPEDTAHQWWPQADRRKSPSSRSNVTPDPLTYARQVDAEDADIDDAEEMEDA